MRTLLDNAVRLIIIGVPIFIVILPFLIMSSRGTPELGNGLARRMIERAAVGNGTADVSDFADKICFTPETGPPVNEVNRLFPGFKLAFKESDDSEGVWFLMLGFNEQRIVKILAVQQIVLGWPIADDDNPADFIRCPKTVFISFEGQPPRITP